MLVLMRKLGERIYIGDDICITVVDIDRGKIRLGIEAPKDMLILREELRKELRQTDRTTQPKEPANATATSPPATNPNPGPAQNHPGSEPEWDGTIPAR